jgi:hypothetical protein
VAAGIDRAGPYGTGASAVYPRAVRTLSVRAVLRASLSAWKRDFGFLTILAVILEAPIVLAEVAAAHGNGNYVGTDEGFTISLSAGALFLTSSLVHHFLAGVMESIERSHREEHHLPTLRELAKQLPWLRLIIADLLIAGAITVGLILFIVPGILIGALTAITLPLLNMERQPIGPTLRRSFRLTQHSLWRVVVLWLLTTVVLQGAQEVVGEVAEHFTKSTTGEFVAHLAAQVVFLPMVALPMVMLAFELVAIDADVTGEVRSRAREVPGDGDATESVVTPDLG